MTNWYVSTNGNANYSGSSETLKESGNTATISSKVLTDNNANFNSIEDNVDYVHIVGGTGVTAGYYKIISHTTTTLILEIDPGDSSAGDVEYYVGGAVTLDEMMNIINNKIAPNPSTFWLKADGIYTTDGLTFSAGGIAYTIEGYTSTIGDNGKATIKRSGGTGNLIQVNSWKYVFKNLIIDGNNSGGHNLDCRQDFGILVNIESKNAGQSGFYRSKTFNCYSHDNNQYGYYLTYAINCLSYNNAYDGFNGVAYAINCISKGNGRYGFYLSKGILTNCIAENNSSFGIYADYYSIIVNCISKGNSYGIYFGSNYSYVINTPIENNDFYDNTNLADHIEPLGTYYELDPQFKDPANFDYTRTGNNLSDKGFSEVGMKSNIDYAIDIGIDQKIKADYPSENDVRNNVSYDNGNKTGNLQLPSENDVRNGASFGSNGVEFTGNLKLPAETDVRDSVGFGSNGTEYTGSLDLPNENDVRDGITFDNNSKTGNLKLPATTDVRESVGYGSNGTEKVGSLDLPSENDVRLNTKYDNNSKTGKLDLPSTHDVEEGVKYDQNSKVGEFVVPDEGNVKKNVSYGYNNEFTGTLETTNIELPLNIITELDGEININVEVDK